MTKTAKALVFFLAIFGSLYGCNNANSQFQVTRLPDGRSVKITGYTGQGGEVRIPARLMRLPVTEIGEEAFAQRGLTSVSIPGSVTVIGNGAFAENQLTSVTIPNGVTRIGEWAFFGNRLTTVSIPGSVVYIEPRSFSRNQLTSVTIAEGVTGIGIFAFANNLLPSIVIPDSVTTILNGAFLDNRLERITIGPNVSFFGPVSALVMAPAFDNDFVEFYHEQGLRAGTYTNLGFLWIME